MEENKLHIQKRGFTLAEVLITLGIVGIIAALTLPVLNKHFKQKEYSTKLKKMYSEILNIGRLNQADTGLGITEFETSLSPREFLDTFFKPYLKGAIPCTGREQCWKGGKMPTAYSNTVSVSEGLILADGRILALSVQGNNYINNSRVLVVDVNGAAGDNKNRHDIFQFWIYKGVNF